MDEPLPRLLNAARQLGIEDRMLPLAEGATHIFHNPSKATRISEEELVQNSL